MDNDQISKFDIISKTTDVIAAYVSKNAINSADLPDLMSAVHTKLKELANCETEMERPDPAVPINKSITKQHIICLEDGAKLKMLKRYIRARYNLSPDQYRKRWGLPSDYPMVAPEYAKRRSNFAKEFGLGKSRS